MHLIYRGAEAEIYKSEYLGMSAVEKLRVKKEYRIPEIDLMQRTERTKTEVYNIVRASKILNVPKIFDVNIPDAKITMQFIEGAKLRDALSLMKKEGLAKTFRKLGHHISSMHSLNISHGDLTTSNMIINKGKIYFVDFGLAHFTRKNEDKAVDLSVFKKMIYSTHYKNFNLIWNSFLEGYQNKDVLNQLKNVEKRGRYICRAS